MQGVARLEGGIDAATKAINVEFDFPDAPSRWVMGLEVTNKPMINLVWLGVIVMGLGTLVAMGRRSLEARKGAMIETAAAAGLPDETPENVVMNTPPATSPAPHGKGKRKASVAET
jgi:hypothetical protein